MQNSTILNNTARLEWNTGFDTYISHRVENRLFFSNPSMHSTFSLNGLHKFMLEFQLFSRETNYHAENTICPSKPK